METQVERSRFIQGFMALVLVCAAISILLPIQQISSQERIEASVLIEDGSDGLALPTGSFVSISAQFFVTQSIESDLVAITSGAFAGCRRNPPEDQEWKKFKQTDTYDEEVLGGLHVYSVMAKFKNADGYESDWACDDFMLEGLVPRPGPPLPTPIPPEASPTPIPLLKVFIPLTYRNE